jgi:hypothetical protein
MKNADDNKNEPKNGAPENSSQNEKKQRPNAKYKLTGENIDLEKHPEKIVYHYDRERRLANAPQSVQDLYNAQPKRRFGFFSSLVGDKQRRGLFIAIIFLCALIMVLSRLNFLGTSSHEFDGNRLSLSVDFSNESFILNILKVQENRGRPYTGSVDISVFPIMHDMPLGSNENTVQVGAFYNRIFFTDREEEFFSFALPFSEGDIAVIIRNENKTLTLTP